MIPVCAGINLEYYFCYVDPTGYGCGSKLPHNITALLGVMDGAASDLRPGLPWQMVEIHEPVRILFVIESTPAALSEHPGANAGFAQLVENEWVQLATLDPNGADIHLFRHGRFEPYAVETSILPSRQILDGLVPGLARSPGICLDRPGTTAGCAGRAEE